MSSVLKPSDKNSRIILEELEPRRLFSGGIEGLIPTSAENLTGPIFRDLDTHNKNGNEAVTETTAQSEQRTREIVFVDAGVENYQQFVDDVENNSDAERQIEVIVLDRDKNGIEQISTLLQDRSDIDAIHIISHGSDGNIQLGNSSLNADQLQHNSATIALWANAFNDSGDILIYGCDLASSSIGQNLINQLSALTLTDVAASNDLTGAASQGGDWLLEFTSGKIESQVVLSAELQNEYQHTLASYTVSSLADSGADTLRQAILDANANGGADTIEFTIAGTINLSSGLPSISEQVTIDGSTAPGYAGEPLVNLDGSGVSANGLTFTSGADNSTVNALMITNFTGNGIQINSGADGISITGNWIGTTGTGATGDGNTNNGINVQGANTIIGGTGVNEGNVITHNGNEGINLTGSGATGTIIQGNIIGLDPDGSTGSGNTDVGIAVLSGAHNTTIGGTTEAARNIISNNFEGIEINSNNNTVQGNYIGTDITGTLDRGNDSDDGIEIQNNATGNLIGGTEEGAGNLIAFNALDGINIVNGSGNTVLGNDIYSNGDQSIDLGAGANSSQSAPSLSTAAAAGNQIVITGSLSSAANNYYRIEFFASEGGIQTYIGYANVATDGSGNAIIDATLSASVGNGGIITATATLSDATYTNFTNSSEFSLGIVAINNTPINSVPGPQSVNENTALIFNAANGNLISISDADAGGGDLAVTLEINDGTLTLSSTTGLTFVGGSNGSQTMMVSGTLTDINAALDGLSFTPDTNFNGPVSLQITTHDDTSLIASYTFDNLGNLGADDGAGTVYDGTLVGTTSVNDATRGDVLSLDGNSHIEIPGFFGEPANVTLATWVNLTAYDTNGTDIISLGDNLILRYEDWNDSLNGSYYDGTAWNGISFLTTINLDGDGWHHVAYSVDDTNNTHAIYFDGVEVASAAMTGSIAYTNGTNSYIGAHGELSPEWDLIGLVDDAQIYDRALNAAEIADIMSNPAGIDSDTVTITVNAVNDAPTATSINAAQSYTEDTALNLTDIVITDVDSANVTATLTLSDVAAGSLNMATSGSVTSTFVGGVWTASGAIADVNTLLAGVTFTPTLNYNSNFTIAISVDDGVATAVTGVKNMTGTAVNDAPIANADSSHLIFDGDDFIQISDHASLQMTNNLTMEVWINHSGNGTGTQIIVNKEGEYELGITSDTGEIKFAIANAPTWDWHDTGYFVTANEWTHIAVTYDAVAGEAKTFINGNLVDTYSQSGAVGDVYPTFNDLFIGGRENVATQRFQGSIDDVRIWDSTRTESEVQTNYSDNLSGAEPGLAGNWRLNEADGTLVADQSANGNDGTLGGVEGIASTPTYDGYFTNEDTLLVIPAVDGVLANDFDAEGDALTVTNLDTTGMVGTLILNSADGSFSYDPRGAFDSLDVGEIAYETFTYTASDGTLDSNIVSVTITVTGAEDTPVFDSTAIIVATEDLAYSYTVTTSDVDIETVTITAPTLPAWLSFVDNGNGTATLSGTPTNAEVGNHNVVLNVSDGTLNSNQNFTIGVSNTNDVAVIAGVDTGAVQEDVAVVSDNISTTGTLTIADPDTGESSFQAATINGTYGALTIDTAGNWTYTANNTQAAIQQLDLGESVADMMAVSAFDGTTHNLVITINGSEDAAVITGTISGTVTEDGTLTSSGALAISDTDTSDTPSFADVTSTAGDNGYGSFVMMSGTWTYTLDNNNAAMQALDVGETLSDTHTFAASDGSIQQVTITINGAEDIPVFDSTAIIVSTEDLAYSYTVTTSDVDIETVTITAPTLPSWLTFVDNGDGTATLSGTPTNAEVGNHNVVLNVSDSTLNSNQNFTLTVTNANDAPILSGANNLSSINEDEVTNSGTLVSALISGQVTDDDPGSLSGIAVVGVDNTNGSWEYTLDGGSNWLTLGAPSSGFARLLAADAGTLVRFLPSADYNGTVTNGITFHAWDQTTGNNGDEVNLSGLDSGADSFSTVSYSNNDGTTPWTSDWVETDGNGGGATSGYSSINAGSLQLQLAAGDSGDNIYREIDLSGATVATLNFDYQNILSGEDEIRVQVSSNGGASYTTVLTFSGAANTGSGSTNIDISSEVASNTRIRFIVFKNDAGNDLFIDNLAVTYDNGDPLPGGQTAFSSATGSSSITVTPVSDAAVIGGVDAGAVTEDVAVVSNDISTTGTLTVTDPDTGESIFQAATINGTYGDLVMQTNGNWTYTADNTQAAIQQLDALESITDTLTVTSFDGTTHNVVITINGSEDAAVITGTTTGSVTEDGTLTSSGPLTISDTDTSDTPSFADVTSTAGDNGYGSFVMTASTWTYTLDNNNAAIQALDVGETLSDTLTFAASDGSTQVVSITITGSNDAPVISNGPDSASLIETNAGLSTTGDLLISDVDTTNVVNATVNSLVISGTSDRSDAAAPGDAALLAMLSINPAAILDGTENSDTLNWTFDSGIEAFDYLSASQTLILQYTIRATDDSSAPLSDIETVTITITGSNDAPVAVNAAVNTLENTVLNSTVPAASDVDGTIASYALGGTTVAQGSLVFNADGSYRFNPGTDFDDLTVGATRDVTFSYTAIDNDGTPSAEQTITITVIGSNNLPIIGGTTEGSLTEDINVSGGTIGTSGRLTISDSDEGHSSFVAATTNGNYGSLMIDAAGNWNYQADNNSSQIQSLRIGETLVDTLAVTTFDGSSFNIDIRINGSEEPEPPTAATQPEPETAPPVENELTTATSEPPELMINVEVDAALEAFDAEEIYTTPQTRETQSLISREPDGIDQFSAAQTPESSHIRLHSYQQATEAPEEIKDEINVGSLSFKASDDEMLKGRLETALLARIEQMSMSIDGDTSGRNSDSVEVQVFVGATTSLTAGIVSWVLRGGSLLASFMSTVPLLNRFDPLPILKSRNDEEDIEPNDDTELTGPAGENQRRVDKMFTDNTADHQRSEFDDQ